VKERKEHPHLSPLPSRERRLGNIFPSRERKPCKGIGQRRLQKGVGEIKLCERKFREGTP